jgi:microcystin-dependent protein
MYAGSTTSHTGYLPCNGSSCLISGYSALYSAIGTTTYGGNNEYFNLPNYQGIFLRGNGSQNVGVNQYNAPSLGQINLDSLKYVLYSNFTAVKNFVTGASIDFGGIRLNLSEAVTKDNFNYSTSNETAPVNMSINYFIKY